jgi:hypothetical protein
MMIFKTKNGNEYGIVFGYGILAQYSSSLFKHVTDETLGVIKDRAAKAAKKGNGTEIALREDQVWEFFTPEDFRNLIIGNVDFGLETMAKAIRTLNGNPIGANYEERYDFVLGMDAEDGRQIADYISDRVGEFQEGMKEQGESGPSSEKPGREKAQDLTVQS